MKTKKQTDNTLSELEKTLTIAGMAIIIIGCIANLYSAYTNQRFINDAIDIIYYLRYIILLVLGFGSGYLLTGTSSTSKKLTRTFVGVMYAFLAVALFFLFDIVRFGLQNFVGIDLTYPWGKLLFMGMPVAAVAATVVVAYLSQFRKKRTNVSPATKAMLIFSFVVTELYMHVGNVASLLNGSATLNSSMPMWDVALGYMITPLAISVVAWLLLQKIANQFNKLFYAIFIGILYKTLTFVLWEFRTDASNDATDIFNYIVSVTAVAFVGVLLYRSYQALSNKRDT